MEKDLKTLLKEFLLEEDVSKVNNYFANDFSDDFDNVNNDVLDYLTEEFYFIDMMYHEDYKIDKQVKEVLNKAIKMLEDAN